MRKLRWAVAMADAGRLCPAAGTAGPPQSRLMQQRMHPIALLYLGIHAVRSGPGHAASLLAQWVRRIATALASGPWRWAMVLGAAAIGGPPAAEARL